MELSAFAHLTKRNIKVIQPGLVYVIEWHAGDSSTNSTSSITTQHQDPQDPHPEPRRSKRTHRPPPSTSSPSTSKNQDETKQIVKIGTGKHGYYVYEEISDSEEEEEVEETLKPDCPVDQDAESGGDTVYVAYVFPFSFLSPTWLTTPITDTTTGSTFLPSGIYVVHTRGYLM